MTTSEANRWIRLAHGCACYCLVMVLPLEWTTGLVPIAWDWACGHQGEDA